MIREDSMCPDDSVNSAIAKTLKNLKALTLWSKACQNTDTHTEGPQSTRKRLPMLIREDNEGRQE